MAKKCNEESFMTITNRNIYEKLCDIEKKQIEMIEHQKATNGRVKKGEKLTYALFGISLSLVMAVAGWLISHLLKG